METFWRYVRIQLVVFVFGIVGPIFLVVYFTAAPDPELRFMYWAGLIVTTIDVLIALSITNGMEMPRPKSRSRRSGSKNAGPSLKDGDD